MNKLINLALRRNLFFPSAEIYPNAPAGFYDFGPTGLAIRNNIVSYWRNYFLKGLDAIEVDGSIILPEKVFEASGHLTSFFDPAFTCNKCKSVYRADKILNDLGYEDIGEKTSLDEIEGLIRKSNFKCNKCGSNDFTKPFRFIIMFQTNIGVGNVVNGYLKPEACQSIFLDFLRIYKGSRRTLPLPIAQVSKAFRNEIAPRNSIIRGREFNQMDVEVFFDPEKNKWDLTNIMDKELPLKTLETKDEVETKTIKEWMKKKVLNYDFEVYYLYKVYDFYRKLGFNKELLRFKEVSKVDRPFYSLATWDFEAKVEDLGWVELVANNYRTDYDLKNHQNISKSKLTINEESKDILPHIFEMSAGVERTFYCLLAQNLEERKEMDLLKLRPLIAPHHVAIFPLVNKDGLDTKAKELYNSLPQRINALYDDKGSIGKRYARIDEIGIRYALTFDNQTLVDNTITIRDAWTTEQRRIKINDVVKELDNLIR